jgi:hypothetical protein
MELFMKRTILFLTCLTSVVSSQLFAAQLAFNKMTLAQRMQAVENMSHNEQFNALSSLTKGQQIQMTQEKDAQARRRIRDTRNQIKEAHAKIEEDQAQAKEIYAKNGNTAAYITALEGTQLKMKHLKGLEDEIEGIEKELNATADVSLLLS